MSSTDPYEPHKGDVPRCAASLVLAAREHGETLPRCDQWALRLRTAYTDLVVDDGGRLRRTPTP